MDSFGMCPDENNSTTCLTPTVLFVKHPPQSKAIPQHVHDPTSVYAVIT